MKPNIFHYRNYKNEDQFTSSLAYLLNLLPKVGNRFVSKISKLGGYSENHLGAFENAEFSGFEFQNPDSKSKPDMIIQTNKTRLFFENKLSAPLSKNQLERHFYDVKKMKGKLVFVCNQSTNISRTVLSDKDYIKPKNRSHFVWSDFEPVFDIRIPSGTTASKIMTDFKQSLKLKGIKGRQMLDCNESLYLNGSDSQDLALDKLREMLKEIGFKVSKGKTEHTLRVNLEKAGKDPLLNPRFYSSFEDMIESWVDECLIIHIWANKKEKEILKSISRVAKLSKIIPGIKFLDFSKNYDPIIDSGKQLAGIMYVPSKFVDSGSKCDFEWGYVKKVWEKIYELLAFL